jgi:hypothetical protein
MAKKNVSARVPPKIADAIDEYAELWDLNRTDAMTALLTYAVEDPPNPEHVGVEAEPNPSKGVYTVELEPELADTVEVEEVTPEEAINNVLRYHKRVFDDI